MRRSSTLAVALVAVAVLAGCSRPAPPPEPVRAVRVTTVEPGSAGRRYEFAGEIRARTESWLSFRVGGKLVRRNVDLGDVVRRQQALAQLDPSDLRLGQDAAQAALVAARVNYTQAEADLRRFTELRERGFISSAELERHDTAYRSARAQLDQARAQAGVQGNQAAYSSLVADASGVVTGVEAEPGMVVAAGTPILRLAHDGPRDVVFDVPEDRVAQVREAAARTGALKVLLWGSGQTPIDARVREIAAAADPVTRTFLVKADIGTAAVRLGQTATVTLAVPTAGNAIKLPLTAVWAHQGGSAVWLLDRESMTVKAQPIEVGGADGNAVVVAGGLAPGQTVVTAGVHVLTPGQKVKLYVERSASAPASSAAGTALPAEAAAADGVVRR